MVRLAATVRLFKRARFSKVFTGPLIIDRTKGVLYGAE